MNRNTELHFASLPSIDISRSKLDKSFDHKTSFNCGDLIPIFYDDIVPGTSVKMKMSEVVRMMTPIVPVMDNAYLDTYFFFVPYRLLWDHFKQFMGELDTAPWVQQQNYEIPQITCPSGGWAKGSLADYFGFPTGVIGSGWKASALPFRAYVQCYNDWFLDENVKTPIYMTKGDSDTTGKNYNSLTYNEVTDTECGAKPLKAAKLHDYFTSALPQAQRGPSISVPLGESAPVKGAEVVTGIHGGGITTRTQLVDEPLAIIKSAGNDFLIGNSTTAIDGANGQGVSLVTDLSQAIGATVNQLRQAFAVQKFYERSARSGCRYIETILAHFRTTNPDFRMQRAEYCGGRRIPINMNQVIQTDATMKNSWWDPDEGATGAWKTDEATPQGNAAAYSVTADSQDDLFTKSFTEHGCLIGLAVVRTQHTYQQGLRRCFSRKKMFDFYWPELANLGEMAVLNKELYLQGTSKDDEAFGYQEAWADYRFMPDQITGELRSNYAQSLDIWHYGDDYSALPTLSAGWIDEPEDNMARTLAVQSHDQLFGDFYFKPVYTLPMPLYSVPGLIDHH